MQDPQPGPPPAPAIRRNQEERLLKAWSPPRGWRYFSEVNNTRVGPWYIGAVGVFFLFGGVLALLIRIQLAVPRNDFLSAALYNQIFTLHGSVMMFLFAVPIFEAVSILLLPQMLGARDLPFPRLSAYGFWGFLLGGIFLCGSIFFNAAPAGGWFMYPPLTTTYQPGIGADIWLLGFSFIEVAAIAAAVELIVGVLKCRAPGMRINLIPLYCWYVLVAAAMILFAFPPLIAGTILLELERAFHWPFFDATRGGDPLLWQHLFWIFGHPDVYIVFLPSVALIAMIVPTFARRHIVGYSWIVLAAVGTGFLSFGLWVHHMFTTGLPGISLALFSGASMAVAIPTGVQFFCFLATLLAGRVATSVPLLYIFGGLSTFVIGGLTGVMVAAVPFNFQAHDTFFIVGHLHSVLIGGTIFPLVAGFYYFYPIATGKMLSDRLGRVAFWLMFVGFNLAFLPMHITGLRGMPRRVFTYPEGLGFDGLNLASSIGAFVLGAGFVVFVWDLIRPKGRQPYSERNPWGAGTLEWLQEMPAKPWGVRSVPEIDSRYPLWDQPNLLRDVDEGRFYLPDADDGRREMIVTTIIDSKPVQCLQLPGPSYVALVAAVFTGTVFFFPIFHLWWPTAIGSVLLISVVIFWLWTGTAAVPKKASKDIGLGLTLPLYASGSSSVGWWAMFITMLADMTAFVSLVFGYFFFWTIHRDFPPDPAPGPGLLWPSGAFILVLSAWGLFMLGQRWNRTGKRRSFLVALAAAAIAAVAGGAALVAGPWTTGLDPTMDVYAATVWVLVIWTVFHIAIGLIMLSYLMAGGLAGRVTAQHDSDVANVALYWHFVAITIAITVGVVAGFPLAV